MKAHIPPRQLLSNQSLKAVDQYIQEESHSLTRRLFKLVAIAANDLYDFGAGRHLKLTERVSNLILEHQNDEIFWQHVGKRCQQMGLDYEPEDYDKMEQSKRR